MRHEGVDVLSHTFESNNRPSREEGGRKYLSLIKDGVTTCRPDVSLALRPSVPSHGQGSTLQCPGGSPKGKHEVP